MDGEGIVETDLYGVDQWFPYPAVIAWCLVHCVTYSHEIIIIIFVCVFFLNFVQFSNIYRSQMHAAVIHGHWMRELHRLHKLNSARLFLKSPISLAHRPNTSCTTVYDHLCTVCHLLAHVLHVSRNYILAYYPRVAHWSHLFSSKQRKWPTVLSTLLTYAFIYVIIVVRLLATL